MKKGVLILLVLLASCKVSKEKASSKSTIKNDIDRSLTEVIESKREGGSVHKVYYPVFKPRAKDSTDITRSGSAKLKTVFKKDGSTEIGCYCDEIWERLERRLDERDKTLTALKTSQGQSTREIPKAYVLYAIGLLIVVTIGAMWYVTWSVKKNFKMLNFLK